MRLLDCGTQLQEVSKALLREIWFLQMQRLARYSNAHASADKELELSMAHCYVQDRGTLALAEGLCMRLLDYGASPKERAKALLREIRSLQVRRLSTHLRRRYPYL